MKRIITLFVTVATLTVSAQESVLLRLKYDKGASYETTLNMDQDLPMAKTKSTMTMKSTVVGIKDGIYEIDNQFDKIISKAEVQGQVVNYDSNVKEADMEPSAKMMHMQMSPLLNSVVAVYFDKMGRQVDAKVKKGQANAEQFKAKGALVFPKEAVKVGSNWKSSVVQGPVNISSVYTVKKIENNKVTIDVAGSVSGEAQGEILGEAIIDAKTGLTVSSKIDMTMSSQGMQIKMSVLLSSKML